jgi:hypothetical protein
MSQLAKRLLVLLAAVAAIALAATPSYAAAPDAWRAQASFERPNPFDPSGCIVLKLDLQVTTTAANVDYWARDTCFGFDYDHLTGSTTLAPNQVSLGSFDSASVTNVAVTVSGAGYFQVFTFNLTWTGTGKVTISHPNHGAGQVTRGVSATVAGSVLDLGGNNLFSGSDVSDAEIEQVLHTLG